MPSSSGRPRRFRAELTGAGWTYLGLSPVLATVLVFDPRTLALVALWAAFGAAHLVLARLNFAGLRLRLETVEQRTREGRGVPLDLVLERRVNPLAAQGLSLRLHHADSPFGQQIAVARAVRRGRPTRQRAMIVPSHFGQLFINAAEVGSRYPFGLYRLSAEWLPPPTATIAVWPRQSRVPARAAGLHAETSLGIGASSQPGVEVRPYQPGDALTLICWKSTARTGRHQVRPREVLALHRRELVVSTQRAPWSGTGQFWSMIALAAALLEDGFRRRSVAALRLDERILPLRTPEEFVAAMDALCTAHPRRHRPPAEVARSPFAIHFRPFGRHGVRAVTEKGAVMSHVA
jgi:uncharacterized protein (DUF58 family)